MAPPIVIIGMSRSGTTLVGRLLESQPGVHLETEPHMVWKAGSFAHVADDRVEDDTRAAAWIRHTLLSAAGAQTLEEKIASQLPPPRPRPPRVPGREDRVRRT